MINGMVNNFSDVFIDVFLQEFITGFIPLVGYFVACVICVLLVKKYTRVSSEPFRKILHFVLLFSLIVFVLAFRTWWVSASAALVFAVAVYPVLVICERIEGFSAFLIERKKGEIRQSLTLAFGMFAAMIGVCWGWLDDKWLVLAGVFAWGYGDAAAALIGKRFGRHMLEGRLIEGRKSVEGAAAMFAASFMAIGVILWLRGGMPWYGRAVTAATAAAACAATELYTLGGYDTVTCPFAAAAVIIPFTYFWS